MNKVILMGRLTKDPEVRYSNGAQPVAVARYSLAVNRQFKKEGQPDVDFLNCVAFGKTGEFAEKYFKKGQMVAVTGRLQVNTVEDQNSGQKRTFTDIIVDDQYFAESKQSFESRMGGQQTSSKAPAKGSNSSNDDSGYFADAEGFMPIEEQVEDEELPF